MYPFRSADGDSPSEIQCQGHTLQSVPRKMDTEGKETQSTEPSHVAQSCVNSSRAEVLQISTQFLKVVKVQVQQKDSCPSWVIT